LELACRSTAVARANLLELLEMRNYRFVMQRGQYGNIDLKASGVR
jgi:hypothetical protein